MGLSTTPRASSGVLVRRRSAARVGAGGETRITRASPHAARRSIDVTIDMVSTGPAADPVCRCNRACSRWGETPCPTRSRVIAAAFSAPRLLCSLLASAACSVLRKPNPAKYHRHVGLRSRDSR